MSSILKVDQLQDSGGNAIITSDGSGNLTAGTIPATTIGTGAVLQVVNATHSTQVSWSSQDVETFIYQGSITPLKSTSKILAIACVGGLSNGGSGRLSGRIRWDTSSGGTSGTQIAGLTQVALDGSGTSHVGTMSMTGLSDAVGTTSTLYFKVTMVKGDSGGTMYACQYGSQSQISIMEIAG